MFADANMALHPGRHADDPLQCVELVEALVEQHAAALALPCGAPVAALIIRLGPEPVGHDPNHANQVAQFAALYQFANLLVARLDAHLEHAGERQLRPCFGGGDEALGVGLVRGDRFFHHHMQAGLERGDAECGMLKMRRGNH